MDCIRKDDGQKDSEKLPNIGGLALRLSAKRDPAGADARLGLQAAISDESLETLALQRPRGAPLPPDRSEQLRKLVRSPPGYPLRSCRCNLIKPAVRHG